jgi:polysaccharide export outer membrane protein
MTLHLAKRTHLLAAGFAVLLPGILLAQAQVQQQLPQQPGVAPQRTQQPEIPREGPTTDQLRPNYTLGPNDQILIRAPEMEEINDRPFRIDSEGQINMPLLGRVGVGGLTVRELETLLVGRLRQFVKEPQVIVTVVQFRAEPVFFVGAFRAPGIYPLQGRRTLVEMLASIGGLQPNASRRIRVTRRAEQGPIPLPNAMVDPDKKVSTVEISMGSLRENVNPAEDIVLQPFDVITVERAELVYVTGEVGRIGALELGERDSISLTQALTLSGGLTKDSKGSKVRVLRPVTNTARRAEIEVNADRVFKGKENDFPLLPNDILYVPRSSRANWRVVGYFMIPLIPTLIWAFTSN